ncbi:MAG: DUF2207 family protein [Bacillota bacterium]
MRQLLKKLFCISLFVPIVFTFFLVSSSYASDERGVNFHSGTTVYRDSSIIMLLGTLVILVYYSIMWARVGRDPKKGNVVTKSKPPENYSPEALRYIEQMKFDNKAFTVAIINMAVKRYLNIREDDGVYILSRGNADKEVLSKEEKRVAEALRLDELHELELSQANHRIIGSAVEALTASLKKDYVNSHFILNTKYFMPGVVFSLFVIILSGSKQFGKNTVPLIIFSFLGLMFLSLTARILSLWKKTLIENRKEGSFLFESTILCSIAFFLLMFQTIIFINFSFYLHIYFVLSVFLILSLNVIYNYLLRAPTVLGRKILDEVDGFRMYLTYEEQGQNGGLDYIEKTPELFERYLPYALALDVEVQWGEQFDSLLQKAKESGHYVPSWYHGPKWSRFNVAKFASSLGSSFSSAVSSSSSAPSSS